MKDLEELQKAFVTSLLSEDDAAITDKIIPGGNLNPSSALDVYRQGYFARLTEALGETYESVWWTLGDEDFFATCKEYIKQQPSLFYNLSDFGQGFSQFLNDSHYIKDIPFLTDLAQFEWQFKELFHRAAHTEIKAPQVSPTENSQFIFTLSCCLFKSQYSIYDIWTQRSSDSKEALAIDVYTPQWLLLRKLNNDIFIHRIEEPQHCLYKNLKEKSNLADTLDKVSSQYKDITDSQVQKYFQELMQFNIIEEVIN